MCYLFAMKQSESEIVAIMEFIRNWLRSVPRGELGVYAKNWGVRQYIFSKLMSAEPGERDAMFSNVYKILKGILNRPPIDIVKPNIDSIMAVKIEHIQKSEYRELFELVVDVLKDYEYADPGQLAVIKGALEAVRATVLARKSQQPEEPGANLSNSADDN